MQGNSINSLQIVQNLTHIPQIILVFVIIWVLIWKSLALWKAAKNDSKVWFIALFLINSVGILEILYIFVFSKYSFFINKEKEESKETTEEKEEVKQETVVPEETKEEIEIKPETETEINSEEVKENNN